MRAYILDQDYSKYLEEDHQSWKKLCERHEKLIYNKVSKEYLKGFHQLNIDKNRIVKIEDVSRRLKEISGWTLVPVTGLLPTKDFFQLLINKHYPVTIYMRKPYEIDFSEQPDIFHDICGHLPLLTNEKFIKFLTKFSTIAIANINNEYAISCLGKLYWFTYEMGIIIEHGHYKPYGGAIITSAEEVKNMQKSVLPKHEFNIEHIFSTEFSPYALQKEYFVISSFDNLFNCLNDVSKNFAKWKQKVSL